MFSGTPCRKIKTVRRKLKKKNIRGGKEQINRRISQKLNKKKKKKKKKNTAWRAFSKEKTGYPRHGQSC